MRIGILISNAEATQVTHSTVHIARAALERGHGVRFIEPWDFEIDTDSKIRARVHAFDAPLSQTLLAETLASRQSVRRSIEVDRLDVLLLRVNPLSVPAHTFALAAQAAGVRVMNDPRSLPRMLHKGYLASLSGVQRPETVVTCSLATAERFLSGCPQGVVVKPARSCGGRGVSLVLDHRPETLKSALDKAFARGDGYAVLQAYLPEAVAGEKRLLWLNGNLLGGYLRMRAPGDFRHNLKAGGAPLPAEITRKDRELSDELTPFLRREGVWFAGIDVIGERVIEVNVLNPGGLHWSGYFSGLDLARQVILSLEA